MAIFVKIIYREHIKQNLQLGELASITFFLLTYTSHPHLLLQKEGVKK